MTWQFASSLGRESRSIFSKFNLFNTDTPLIRTFFTAPSVSVLALGIDMFSTSFENDLQLYITIYLGGYIVRSQRIDRDSVPDATLVCITIKWRLYSKENCIGPSNGLNLWNLGLPEYDFSEVKKNNNLDSLVAKRSVRREFQKCLLSVL